MSGGLTAGERRAVEALDVEGLVDAVRALVGIPSWNGEETAAQDFMAEAMERAGLEVDVWEIDVRALSRHPAYSAEIRRERALGVVGTLPGREGGRTLILNGHVDVVPPGDPAGWRHPPFAGVVEDGSIWGRGALDMKGPLLGALYALRAVRAAGVELDGPVHVQSVVGEEDGGMGTLATIERGYRGDGAIVMEPTGLAVAPALAGVANFRIRVPGSAAHGAVRLEGVSALEKLFVVHRALRAAEAARNARVADDSLFAAHRLPFPICVGTVSGGDWPSSVPDRVTVEGRMGMAPGEDRGAARRELEEAVAAAAADDPWLRDHPPEVEWWGGRFLAAETAADHPLVGAVRAAGAGVTGRPLPLRAMPFGADLGLLTEVGGTPGVLFGPGDIRRAHRPDEAVSVSELVKAARTLAVAAMRFCGARGSASGR